MSPRTKLTVLILVMIACGLYVTQSVYKKNCGIDLFQNWAVSNVPEWSGGVLNNPYLQLPEYFGMLDEYARSSDDLRVKEANYTNRQIFVPGLEPKGTPLFFATFALLPQEYSQAYAVHSGASILLFIASCVCIYIYNQRKWLSYLLLAVFICSVYYKPLFFNLVYGNYNCIQLCAFVLVTYAIKVFVAHDSARHKKYASCAILCALVFLVLLKPNLILVALFLFATVWSLQGTVPFVISTVSAGFFGSGLILLSSLYFDSMTIWADWLNCFTGGGESLSPPISYGNYSAALIVSNIINLKINSTIILIGAVLSTMTLSVLCLTIQSGRSVVSQLFKSLCRVVQDPFISAGLGVTLTLALMPAVWFHYHVIVLLPALWLYLDSRRYSVTEFCALLSIALSSGLFTSNLVIHLLSADTLKLYEPYFVAFDWVPLWIGILIKIATSAAHQPVIESSGPVLPEHV